MNTEKTFVVLSNHPETTMELGEKIGKNLRGGEVIELVSDLGGGKTTFVRGLALGMGANDVSSPSFTISNIYPGNKLILHHFDFYRLSEPGIIADEFKEVINQPSNVVVVEWGDSVHDVMPNNRLIIKLIATSESERKLELSLTDNLAYLLEDIKV